MIHIIVACLHDETKYQYEERMGALPPNFVCNAPTGEALLQAIIDDLAQGSQTLISAWVDSQINPEG